MALLLVVLSWIAGIAILAFELLGPGRVGVLALGVWCIVWPLVAASPMDALADLLMGMGSRRRSGRD